MKLLREIKIKTPESVELEFTLAGIGNRAYALLIDYLIWGLILFVWSFMAINVFVSISNNATGDNLAMFEQWIIALYFLTLFAIYVGYFVFFEVLWQGQTPGKRIVKIRVIQDTGKPERLPQAILRALLRPVDDLFFLGTFFVMFGKQEKRLGDWVAGTMVVQEVRSQPPFKLSPTQATQTLAMELVEETDLSMLTPADFVIIRTYLDRRSTMIPEFKYSKGKELAYQVKDRLGLEGVPEGITAIQFLEAVYLAYQQQNQ